MRRGVKFVTFFVILFTLLKFLGTQQSSSCECERRIVVWVVSHTAPEVKSTLIQWLKNLLESDCVKVGAPGTISSPEYVLSVHYEQAQDGQLPWPDNPNFKGDMFFMEGSHRRSALDVALFESGGKVNPQGPFSTENISVINFGGYKKTWSTESVRMSLEEHMKMMRPQFQKIHPFHKFLEDLEQIPEEVRLVPEKDWLYPGEIMDIKVTDYKDKAGRAYKSNVCHRLLAKVEKGLIRDASSGVQHFFGQEEIFVTHGWEFIKLNPYIIRYMAPTPTDPCQGDLEDTLRIYNSCEIRDWETPVPLEQTKWKDEIATLKIKIKCPEAIARLTATEIVTEIGEKTFSGAGGSETRKRNYRSEIEAKVHLTLKLTQTLPMPMYDERYEYYDVKAIHLTSFRATLRDWEFQRSTDANGWSEITETWDGQDFDANIKRSAHYSQLGLGQVIVVFDTKSKKAKAVNNLGGWVNYTFKRDFLQEGKGVNKTGPFHWTHTDKSEDEKVFSIEPVGEKRVNIPRISLLTFPEYLVTSGDGVNFMTGSGTVSIDDCSHPKRDYTTCKTEKTFKWEFRRNKKNDK